MRPHMQALETKNEQEKERCVQKGLQCAVTATAQAKLVRLPCAGLAWPGICVHGVGALVRTAHCLAI